MASSGFGPIYDYWLDAYQRSVLCLDVLRQRGNIYLEHNASPTPNVLSFKAELVRDGRTLPRPVNYLLVRIIPPEDIKIDPSKAPFIVVDPRAGHGPGIGGMKHDSEIGVALAAGHTCYYVGFLPGPMPGQTIEDVCIAEAAFVEEVAALHKHADGKPVIIANCQAGWQIMMMAAIRPELCGPIMLVGSPLSYWAGVRGKNPMRYLGGVLGGTWLTALSGDLGGGIFDGANLIANFESQDLANTYWKKSYNVYSNVDREVERYLDFETWWGSPVLMNAGEMQWIADNLFVGNKLATGELRTSTGIQVDLRNIKSPIIIFCSWGDNITPPQQALGWLTDLYEHDDEIVANGQTIVYTMHHSIGHLGIFVSGKVATKEHGEFAQCMEMIDMMPPGLYEAVITDVGPDTENPELVKGNYVFTLVRRTLDHIRALGTNTQDDDLRFATAARVSEMNLGLYRLLGAPMVRAMTSDQTASAMRTMHPNRVRFSFFADTNPAAQIVKDMAEHARKDRTPAAPDNPLLGIEKAVSSNITAWLETCGEIRDAMMETFFLNTYGSPLLQAMVGLHPEASLPPRRIARDLAREATESRYEAELEKQFEYGTMLAAALRALIYIRIPEGVVDERGFMALEAIRLAEPEDRRPTRSQLKEIFRTQFLLIKLDERRAVRTIPKMLAHDRKERAAALDAIHKITASRGLSEICKHRLDEIDALFESDEPAPAIEERMHA